MPNVYVFASATRTNIWAGIGAGLWAVNENNEPPHLRKARAQGMPVGAFGLLYSKVDEALTTPFVVLSVPELMVAEERIWPERWVFPFRIRPLGSPRHMYPIAEARKQLGLFADVREEGKWQNKLNLAGTMTFQPVAFNDLDWAQIIDRLVSPE
jgi:hypothetical protein